jgi:eukaryotic-like serine/threonine-protein kinase
MALAPGTSLGPYQIEALAGAGAMGEVYRARDTRLDRTVAIKILPVHIAAAPGLLQRFEREARAIAAVEHVNICPLYDVGATDGINFLVMQYVAGETLANRISRGPIPVGEAIGLAQQIAAGLDAAHGQGIIHRDLKPSNIRLTPEGRVKLVDFGLAKAMLPGSSADPDISPTVTASPTEAGAILGTAAYMSPEQARGRQVDKRTDIWAFGGVLFEMLTGRNPFDGHSLADVLAAVIGRDPNWTALPATTPRRIRELLQRCLQKDPARRLRDIGDARLELDDASAGPGEVQAPVAGGTRWAGKAIAWTVPALALALATTLILLFWRSATRETPSSMRFSLVTNFAGVEAQPSLSPDGRSVAFVSNRDGQWDVYVGLVRGGEPVRLTNDPNVEAGPRFSPGDGSRVLYSRLNESGLQDIWVTPAFPGTPRRLIPNAYSPAWSRDGLHIAYSSGGLIWICDADGTNARQVTKPEPPPMNHDQPAFSSSGKSIAFVRRRLGPRSELALVDIETDNVRLLTEDDAFASSPKWSTDDRFLYFSSSRGGTMNIWRLSMTTSEMVQITAGQGDDIEIDLSADGTRMIFSSYRANTNLAEVSLESGSQGQRKWLTRDLARSETAPRYSPDGSRIAYFTNRAGAEREGIWVMDADGSNATQLVEDDRRTNTYPRWSPDGLELYFYSRAAQSLGASADLRRVPLAGGAPQALPVQAWFPYWGWGDIAKDGRILYRTSESSGEFFDPRTTQRESVPDLPGDPLFSDDGKSFAFAVRGVGGKLKAGLYVSPLGGAYRQVFDGWVIWYTWGSNGDLMYLEGRPDLKGILWRIPPNGQRTMVLKELAFIRRPIDILWLTRFDIHPDGRRIVVEGLESFEADIGMIDNVR